MWIFDLKKAEGRRRLTTDLCRVVLSRSEIGVNTQIVSCERNSQQHGAS